MFLTTALVNIPGKITDLLFWTSANNEAHTLHNHIFGVSYYENVWVQNEDKLQCQEIYLLKITIKTQNYKQP
jgi:hypothetical protein